MALCGSTSGVWRKHPQRAAILAASIPSGVDGVVEVRSQINAYCFGPGFRPLSSAPPSVVHCPKLAGCLPHNHIFIGFGSASRQPSQFLNVSLLHPVPEISFEEYLDARADLDIFLAPLLGKIMVCDCRLGVGCHGHLLRARCLEIFDDLKVKDVSAGHGFAVENEDKFMDVENVIIKSGFVPSGGASAGGVGHRVTATSQPSKQVLPQLIRDGLSMDEHLSEALRLVHPFQREPTVFAPIKYALKFGCDCPKETNERRKTVADLIDDLCEILKVENEFLLSQVHPEVCAVLKSGGLTKNIAAMREIQFIAQCPDFAAIPSLVTGISMVGHCDPVCGMMQRTVDAEYSVDEFIGRASSQNEDILRRVKPSGDTVLDHGAYVKTVEESERGVLEGPYLDLESICSGSPCCIAPRYGVWEKHGEAAESTIRVIDDLLAGGQNGTVSYASSHRPADGDALCAQQRAVQERFPESATGGFTSDFAKAYKQVPHQPAFGLMVIIAVWNPVLGRVEFWKPYSQLFGGRSPPQNFSRYPAWMCFALAVLLALHAQHCVDDVLGMDRMECLMDGWKAWRRIAEALGWDVPDKKSPSPSQDYLAIGYKVIHVGTPERWARLQISTARRDALCQYISDFLREGRLSGGDAGSLFGRMGFALNATQGRFGRALLRPIKRRQYERRANMNPQLESSLKWWLKFLKSHTPRSIPVCLKDKKVVISYSDGEGSGGVGCAIWHPGERPKAAFMNVPWMLRRLWAMQTARTFQGEDQRDIFEIEAIGPLMILNQWPELLEDCLWLHFIDNTAAQSALAKGSSSVESGDVIVSETWRHIVHLRCLPWFDRVASKSNPVDGLSRGMFNGPWEKVEDGDLPKGMFAKIRDELIRGGVKLPA